MTPAVSIRNVDIVFGDRNVDDALALLDRGATRDEIAAETGDVIGVADANIDVHQGEILVLMGLSGSGKSTLLRAVNGLAPVRRGSVEVRCGDERTNPYACSPARLRALRADHVSMVFQQFALLPWRSVAENVGFGLELAGIPAAERRARVAAQLELVGLADWSGRRVGELSGGMQQRVGLARAFATGAPILLMDEPFSALDPLIRTRLQDELLDFQAKLHKTILFVSHDLDEAFRIGNRIAIMEAGRIVQCGTPREIVDNPANRYVAEFVANMNPIAMLTAGDVMVAGRPGAEARQATLSATVKPDTPLADVLEALARRPGTVGVIDNGSVAGSITAQDVVNGLTRHKRT